MTREVKLGGKIKATKSLLRFDMVRANKYWKPANTIETEKLFGELKKHRKISNTKKAKILLGIGGKWKTKKIGTFGIFS